jgi:hypothetical protein
VSFESKKNISREDNQTIVRKPPEEKTLLFLPTPHLKEEKATKLQQNDFVTQCKRFCIVLKSPKISRLITEKPLLEKRFKNFWSTGKPYVVALCCLVLLASIGLVAYTLNQNLQQKQILEQKRAQIEKEILYWQGITKKYKGYRDGYFKLAILEYQLGNMQVSQQYLHEVQLLDPNFKEAEELERILTSGNTTKL